MAGASRIFSWLEAGASPLVNRKQADGRSSIASHDLRIKASAGDTIALSVFLISLT
jgi:hypothetical protein